MFSACLIIPHFEGLLHLSRAFVAITLMKWGIIPLLKGPGARAREGATNNHCRMAREMRRREDKFKCCIGA
jgi:hypothetical protein